MQQILNDKVLSTDYLSEQYHVKIDIGISQCLLGERVRFDGGHKRMSFAVDELAPFMNFKSICPEITIGLPTPRPALRLVTTQQNSIELHVSHGQQQDLTDSMRSFSQQYATTIDNLCGYIVCAKSPSCGMERVRVYNKIGNSSQKSGTGVFTAQMMQQLPWLPIEEDGRLYDINIKENFIIRVYALHRLNQLKDAGLTRQSLLDFHHRYKLLLLSHSQQLYRQLDLFVTAINQWQDLNDYFVEYRARLITLLRCQATRSNHTNVLMHVQGYFRKYLNHNQRQQLSRLIIRYQQGIQPLLAPITLLEYYFSQYPDNYLQQQYYFNPYPEALKLRYGQ